MVGCALGGIVVLSAKSKAAGGKVAAAFLASGGQDVIRQASVSDRDPIEINGQRIRLWGIEMPESDPLCRAASIWRAGLIVAEIGHSMGTGFLATLADDCTATQMNLKTKKSLLISRTTTGLLSRCKQRWNRRGRRYERYFLECW